LSAKTKIEMCLLLPQGNDCEPCLERLQARVQQYRGVEVAHIDRDGDAPRFCVHYDPSLTNVEFIQALATEEGAYLEWRYRHETMEVLGMDCADCAQTLEVAVSRLPGVLWASVNFAASTLAVEYEAEQLDLAAIASRIRSLGYDVKAPIPAREMVFQVEGMDCADCALHLEEALRRTPGVARVSVDFSLARLRVASEDGADVGAAVEQVARGLGNSLQSASAEEETKSRTWREWLWQRRRDLTTVASGLVIAVAVALNLLGLPKEIVAAT
jgi:copper ion binding protein